MGPLPSCVADPILPKRVWMNPISNSLKFARRRDRAVIEIGRYKFGDQCVFRAPQRDRLRHQARGQLFGVFQRLYAREEYGGAGIGPAIVLRIVQRHNGLFHTFVISRHRGV